MWYIFVLTYSFFRDNNDKYNLFVVVLFFYVCLIDNIRCRVYMFMCRAFANVLTIICRIILLVVLLFYVCLIDNIRCRVFIRVATPPQISSKSGEFLRTSPQILFNFQFRKRVATLFMLMCTSCHAFGNVLTLYLVENIINRCIYL